MATESQNKCIKSKLTHCQSQIFYSLKCPLYGAFYASLNRDTFLGHPIVIMKIPKIYSNIVNTYWFLLNAVHTDYKIRKIYSNTVLTDYKNTQDLLKCRKY